jgi:hypothetical protein
VKVSIALLSTDAVSVTPVPAATVAVSFQQPPTVADAAIVQVAL